jgi:hypothetical protein
MLQTITSVFRSFHSVARQRRNFTSLLIDGTVSAIESKHPTNRHVSLAIYVATRPIIPRQDNFRNLNLKYSVYDSVLIRAKTKLTVQTRFIKISFAL